MEGECLSTPGLSRIVVTGLGAGAHLVDHLIRKGIKGLESVVIGGEGQLTCVLSIAGGRNNPITIRSDDGSFFTAITDSSAVVFILTGKDSSLCIAADVARVARGRGAIVLSLPAVDCMKDEKALLDSAIGDSVSIICSPSVTNYGVFARQLEDMIEGVHDMLIEPSLINLDYADLRTVLGYGSEACIVSGEGVSPYLALHSTLDNAMRTVAARHVSGCLLHITGGDSLTLKDANFIAESITKELNPRANVIWGARVRSDYLNRVKITAVLSGANIKRVEH